MKAQSPSSRVIVGLLSGASGSARDRALVGYRLLLILCF